VEHADSHESVGKKKSKGRNPWDGRKCSIHVHHKRTRLADPDGISIKALIDGLCLVGILADDNAKIITEISQSQELAKAEETIIDIIWGD